MTIKKINWHSVLMVAIIVAGIVGYIVLFKDYVSS